MKQNVEGKFKVDELKNSQQMMEYIVNLNRKRTVLLLEDEEKQCRMKLEHWERLRTFLSEKASASAAAATSASAPTNQIIVPIPKKASTLQAAAIGTVSAPFGGQQGEQEESAAMVGVANCEMAGEGGRDPNAIVQALNPLIRPCTDAKDAWKLIAKTLVPALHSVKTSLQSNKRAVLAQLAQESQISLQVYSAAQTASLSTAKLMQRNKRASREAMMFWKRHEKEEREMRKRAKREAIEKMKAEEEEREKRRQAKKLQFLLTQTELYSHFVGKKLSKEAGNQGDVSSPAKAALKVVKTDEVDFASIQDEDLNEMARQKAQAALEAQSEKTRQFDSGKGALVHTAKVVAQPKMLNCQLKPYQLKGLNWLANLYEQGINGILADDMGLGKTVQSISLLAHLAETHNIWGPFLVVSPASTLHNWQQEFAKFAPQLKAIPCWGSVKERKTLRKYWSGNRIFTKDSPAHVVITSYQIVVSDHQYFQRVKWQYMILDEAHAIKSANTARWKTLLNFNCRNRLLLTGTPIQNSMTELWALLHFIMPTIFDSHEEFSEWFSKDIETHAVDKEKGKLNERQLQRLHAILKPFMLRRIKKDVEHELGQKIEKTIYCELTPRQKRMYDALDKTGIDELLERLEQDESLMNQVMQFRKVCNHPHLFEQADVSSPFVFVQMSMAKNELTSLVTYNSRSLIEFHLPQLLWHFYKDFVTLRRYQYPNNILWSTEHLIDGSNNLLDILHWSLSDLLLLMFQNPILSAVAEEQERSSLQLLKEYRGLDGKCRHEPFDLLTVSAGMDDCLDHLRRIYKRLPCWYYAKAEAPPVDFWCASQSFTVDQRAQMFDHESIRLLFGLYPAESFKISRRSDLMKEVATTRYPKPDTIRGFSQIQVPNARQLLFESGKLQRLDTLLAQLKAENHRVLLYFQMTKMIDLMEEYLTFRQYSYLRLDGSSKISDRRDLVSDWQTRPDLFIFLLSTRAGGLGINLTAADTVIFYDSDWNPTVDQQAMDRAHRLGQTRQVTVYRMVTSGTIEERILQRAMQKDEIQKVVIANGTFDQQNPLSPITTPLKPKV